MKYLDLEVFWHVVIFRKKVNISFFKENVNQVFPQNIFERLNGGQWKPHVNAPAVPVQEHSYVDCSRNSAWVKTTVLNV